MIPFQCHRLFIYILSIVIPVVIFISSGPECFASNDNPIWWELENADNYINKYSDPKKSAAQIEAERNLLVSVLGKPKHIFLSKGFSNEKNDLLSTPFKTWVRSPEGRLTEYKNRLEANSTSMHVPADNEKEEGFYLAASVIETGEEDVNSDGVAEKIFIYPKTILGHWHLGASMKTGQSLFVDAPQIALEIAPTRASSYIGSIQVANRSYGMEVLYRGEPASGAKVRVITENGWEKKFITDKRGQFQVFPPQGVRWETYIYVAEYLDNEKHEFHQATLPMLIDPPWPEWRSWHGVLIFWSLSGLLFLVILIIAGVLVKKRQKKLLMVKFSEGKVKTGIQ